jgi:hypothetical protein
MKNNLEKEIVFAGHFELFEKITAKHKKTVEDAKKIKGDLAILIGDIGVSEKLEAFIESGTDGLKYIYQRRIDCAKSLCTISQLPKPKSILKIVDIEQYKIAEKVLKKYPDIMTYIENKKDSSNDKKYSKVYNKYLEVLKEEIIPILVNKNLMDLGMKEETKIYSERKMRNKVSKKMKSKEKGQWAKILFNTKDPIIYKLFSRVEINHGNPSCRGILLALYQTIAEEGYIKIHQYYLEKHALSLIKAGFLYGLIRKKLVPKLKELIFENKFY